MRNINMDDKLDTTGIDPNADLIRICKDPQLRANLITYQNIDDFHITSHERNDNYCALHQINKNIPRIRIFTHSNFAYSKCQYCTSDVENIDIYERYGVPYCLELFDPIATFNFSKYKHCTMLAVRDDITSRDIIPERVWYLELLTANLVSPLPPSIKVLYYDMATLDGLKFLTTVEQLWINQTNADGIDLRNTSLSELVFNGCEERYAKIYSPTTLIRAMIWYAVIYELEKCDALTHLWTLGISNEVLIALCTLPNLEYFEETSVLMLDKRNRSTVAQRDDLKNHTGMCRRDGNAHCKCPFHIKSKKIVTFRAVVNVSLSLEVEWAKHIHIVGSQHVKFVGNAQMLQLTGPKKVDIYAPYLCSLTLHFASVSLNIYSPTLSKLKLNNSTCGCFTIYTPNLQCLKTSNSHLLYLPSVSSLKIRDHSVKMIDTTMFPNLEKLKICGARIDTVYVKKHVKCDIKNNAVRYLVEMD